jgi:hypothetical protein
MENTTHTPAQWFATQHSNGSHWFVEYEIAGERYTLVDGLTEAKAKLIATAPELLKFLRDNLKYFAEGSLVQEEAIALVAKAEGQSL